MSKRTLSALYNDRLEEHSGIKRNKKACTECRQQKVRCNASLESQEPCSRCSRMGLSCVISDPFKREHKRQRLSELERETNELRKILESQQSPPAPWSVHVPTPSASLESSVAGISPVMHNGSASPPANIDPALSPPIDHQHHESEVKASLPSPVSPSGTHAQTIEGVTVSGAIIDELFHLYFSDFHQFLPILDTTLEPNELYEQSPLLFWAIAGVACRMYAKDPTLLDLLGDRVLDLSLLSLRKPSISNIKGLLLILTWPLPKAAQSHDTTYAISGSVVHLAMQIGLHIPTSSQDFSRVKVDLTEIEIIQRAELWGHCIITYQRCCSFKGHSPLALLETYQDSEQRHALSQRISPSLRFQLKLNGVVTRCASALLQNGLRIMTKDQEHALDVLIRVFEATMKDIEPESSTDLDKFYLYVARLTIQAFHFYKDPAKKLPTFMLTRLYTSACNVIRHIDRMDSSGIIKLPAAPYYFFYATSLAAFAILRLLKASTAQYMDENAKEAFFLGLNVMKRQSMEPNDGPSRLGVVLTQLWNSEKAFKNPDGSEHMALRIRTRLTMSAVFDCIWWWREEFGGQKGAYTNHEQPSEPNPSGLAISTTTPEVPIVPPGEPIQDTSMSSFLDDHLLAEMGWNNSTNFFYPPIAGPYGTDWYSPTDVNGFAI